MSCCKEPVLQRVLNQMSFCSNPFSSFLLFSFILMFALVAFRFPANAQMFSSGSDGSDGALNLTTPGSVAFFTLPFDADGDGIYHFTTITIAEGVTVDMTRTTRGPVIWLATGDVQIDGVIDLNGEAGHAFDAPGAFSSQPGAGGYSGGNGGRALLAQQSGNGPGGGAASPIPSGFTSDRRGGGGAGHAVPGTSAPRSGGVGGLAYGNIFLLPLLGGSGGGGGGGNIMTNSDRGGGGGAGGGAILIASSSNIIVNGTIQADGGAGGVGSSNESPGGGGSGGSVRLIAPAISGAGILSVRGGNVVGAGGVGAHGRIRIEAFQRAFTGTTQPIGTFATPGFVFLPEDAPLVRVVRVDSVDVPASPTGSFTPADVVINSAGPTTMELNARGIPPGTVVTLSLFPETGEAIVVDSTPLEGTLEAATATATVTVPHGFSRVLVRATWEP